VGSGQWTENHSRRACPARGSKVRQKKKLRRVCPPEKKAREKLDCMHLNPVRAGLVKADQSLRKMAGRAG